jgi:hypothetical protein
MDYATAAYLQGMSDGYRAGYGDGFAHGNCFGFNNGFNTGNFLTMLALGPAAWFM